MVKTNSELPAAILLLAAALCSLVGCERGGDSASAPTSSAGASRSSAAPPAVSSSAGAGAPTSSSARNAATAPIDTATFARLFRDLSEPDRYFFSDNFVSNETSYLQVAPLLEKKALRGGAYLGVGPEQNFSYIAISRPKIAFIVDIRRQNAIEHLLYKAIFDQAATRAAFLCTLLGVHCEETGDSGSQALDAVLDRAEAAWKRRNKSEFRAVHEQLRERIETGYQVALAKRDRETLENVHRAFFTKGLALAFELHSTEHRRNYPTLRELLEVTSASGRQRSFLADESDYRLIQRMQRENRIIPLVGDFAGEHAIKAIGAELRKRDIPVSVFYTSNVEQYLVDPPKWRRWVENVESLPTNEASLFLRCYLDQGRRHPQQLEGHRTASVLQLFDHFRWKQRSRGYTGFWQLATDGVLSE
jgi:hypothetical protein